MSVAISDRQAVSFTCVSGRQDFWFRCKKKKKKNQTVKLACSEERERRMAAAQMHIPLGYVSTLHSGFKIPNKLPAVIFG